MVNNNYYISVITPFHNVEMAYFKECVKSMRNQTIGFDKIEWIIVLHNCQPEYQPMLQEMFANDSNVQLPVLNDEHRTPSAPRNYGITLATAPYLGFLDGDDRYTPECLETVVHEANETDSDMINVRRESIVMSEGIRRINSVCTFNNSVRRDVIDCGHWEKGMFDNPGWGFSTSYFYRSSLLSDNHLLFDTNFVFAEDFYFVLECMVKARKICYLHQSIGYVYIQNDQSLVQSTVKPAETVMKIAENYQRLLKLMDRYGIDESGLVPVHLAIISNFILYSPDITYEQRQKIKTMLEQFVLNINFEGTNEKIYSKEKLQDCLGKIFDVILCPENTIEALTTKEINGEKELTGILFANRNTDVGIRNSFMHIKTMDSYRFRLPLANRDFIKPLINLQTRVGETNLLTRDAVIRYFRLEDSTLLPCTSKHIKPYNEAVSNTLKGHHNLFIAQSIPVTRVTNDEAEVDSLESALVKDYFAYHYLKGGVKGADFMAPVETFFAQSAQSELDYHTLAKYALADADIDQIVSFNTCHVEHFFRFIEENWKQVLNEVDCSDKRKAELSAILSQGFDQPIAAKLWPKLQLVVAYGAGEEYEHTSGMKKYTGSLPHNHGYYFTEETIFGKAVENDSNLFECLRGINYYELIPMMASSEEACRWTDVTIGEPYTLVVTNCAGLYRYVTDHIICPKEVTKNHIYYTIY